MSTRTRTAAVLTALLLALGLSLAPLSTAGAQRADRVHARTSVIPKVGHYEGRDSHHRHIRFYFGSHGQIINFRVEHTHFPPATVHGSQWHHACHNNHCTRGHWRTDTEVHGHWNISTAGGDVAFNARWVSH